MLMHLIVADLSSAAVSPRVYHGHSVQRADVGQMLLLIADAS